ncbi:MAG: TerD family protein [Bacteroidota bacterium]
MSIQLDKKTGINLKKGSKISLEKEGIPLQKVCIGLNWGRIRRKGLLSVFGGTSVDLDGSVCLFDGKNNLLDTIYYRQLRSRDKAVIHSGDDLDGDLYGDDGKDNEVIQINLKKLNSEVKNLFFILNSFKKQDFATIPYAKIRIYEGTPQKVKHVLATFNVSADPKYSGYVSMVMAQLTRKPDKRWEFVSIGDPVPERNLAKTIQAIEKRYV